MDAVTAARWIILYMNGQPCILASGLGTNDQLMTQFRNAMLGKLPEGTTLEIKDIFECPIDDVIRLGVISLMTALSALQQTLANPAALRH